MNEIIFSIFYYERQASSKMRLNIFLYRTRFVEWQIHSLSYQEIFSVVCYFVFSFVFHCERWWSWELKCQQPPARKIEKCRVSWKKYRIISRFSFPSNDWTIMWWLIIFPTTTPSQDLNLAQHADRLTDSNFKGLHPPSHFSSSW